MEAKSRKKRRKESRQAKSKNKFDSWLQHQQSSKTKKKPNNPKLVSNSDNVARMPKVDAGKGKPVQRQKADEKLRSDEMDGLVVKKNGANVVDSDVKPTTNVLKRKKDSSQSSETKSETKSLKRKKKDSSKSSETNFSKFLRMETEGKLLSAEEDLKFERKLAKKLKVKKGRLSARNDDLDVLLEGIPSVLDSRGEGEGDYKISDNGTNSSLLSEEDLDDEMSGDEGSGEEFDSLVGGIEDEEEDEDEEEEDDDDEEEEVSENINKVKRRKTKFEEFLEEDFGNGDNSAEADLKLEKKLAKKLKLKTGNVGGEDGMDTLLDGIPSMLNSAKEELKSSEDCPKRSVKTSMSSKKAGDSNLSEQAKLDQPEMNTNAEESVKKATADPVSGGKNVYVAPHLRSRGGNESEEHAQVRKRIRGLLNRLSESNVESITGEISELYNSVGRSAGAQIVSEEVVSSCSEGPRGNEQYAAVFGAFVAGMACSVGIDFGAKLLARVAKCFEEEYLKEDNLSLRNLTLLLSYLYVFGVCSSELIYDFLIMLSKRLTEVDVSTVLTVLQCCGMNLRGDDPIGMKNFILSVQSRVNEMKASSGDGKSTTSTKRMDFMLETICDIKNNKKRSKDDPLQHTRIKKWLQKLRADDILIRGLKWSKLLDPTKKGQWWLSGDMASITENVEDVSVKIDKEAAETKKMLQLAAAQRMNTDARRAIFCVIMSGEDYVDAFEKLLRLELTGKQDREIMRVLVECCLQEKVFNKYYSILASRLCSHDKNHKFTLQYCLWDHFKELESMTLIRSMHLAKFVAEMVASFSVSLAILKAVDLDDPVQLTPKRIMHFRLIFEAIFEFPDKTIWNIFSRVAVNPEYEPLRIGIKFFISNYVVTAKKSLSVKFQIAKKALSSSDADLML